MAVKAKFVCNSLRGMPGNTKILHMHPVKKTPEDSADFAIEQPSGVLEITITPGTPAAGFFQVGKTYTLTFEESED